MDISRLRSIVFLNEKVYRGADSKHEGSIQTKDRKQGIDSKYRLIVPSLD